MGNVLGRGGQKNVLIFNPIKLLKPGYICNKSTFVMVREVFKFRLDAPVLEVSVPTLHLVVLLAAWLIELTMDV